MDMSRLRLRLIVLFLFVPAVPLWSCPNNIESCPYPDGGSPNDLPSSCPDGGGPSFQADVLPLFKEFCLNCHPVGGNSGQYPTEPSWLFAVNPGTGMQEDLQVTLDSIYSCYMPPSDGGAPQMNICQRETVLTWFACGGQNN